MQSVSGPYRWRRGVRGVHHTCVCRMCIATTDAGRRQNYACHMIHVACEEELSTQRLKRHIFESLYVGTSRFGSRLFRLGIVWRNDERWTGCARAVNGTHYVIGLKRKSTTREFVVGQISMSSLKFIVSTNDLNPYGGGVLESRRPNCKLIFAYNLFSNLNWFIIVYAW